MERPDAAEPREDDLPPKPPPEPVDDNLTDQDLEGEDVAEDDFLSPMRARDDPTVDDQERDDDGEAPT